MRIQASLNITDIEAAQRAAQCHEKGRTFYDAGLFGKTFGQVVLEQFQGIRLIGEIERREGPETYEVLKTCLNDILSATSLPQLCRNASPSWRAILSLYFVWTGTFNYGEESGRELWPHIMNGLGWPYDPTLSTQCGKLFLECLKENQLETFDMIEERQIYIARILLHGLIPQKHIGRFIAELIEPELQSCNGRYVTSTHLLQKCRQISTYSYLPKPITRFVEHGQPVVDFVVKRFLEMAERWDEDQPNLWQRWGLPKYMVEAFRRHVENRGVPAIRTIRPDAVQTRPYLHFSLDGSASPCLHIPRQPLDATSNLHIAWISPEGVENTADIPVRRTPFGGKLYADSQDIEIAPGTQGWELVCTDELNREISRQRIPALMLCEDLPVFVFHPSTGRLLNVNRAAGLPEHLLLVFPADAKLQIIHGECFNEPERLAENWRRWQWVICELPAHGSVQYSGPNAAFDKQLHQIDVPLTRSDAINQPEFDGRGQAPFWLRCLAGWPLFLNPSHITLSCSESGYRIWKRAFCTLKRRDTSEPAVRVILDFAKTPKGYEARLATATAWRSGVYELFMRGALGIDDVELTFVLLPLTNLERHINLETNRVDSFQGYGFDKIACRSLQHTTINMDGARATIMLKADQGEAYCGMEVFSETPTPVVLLFARSSLRWARRAERGIYDWALWRCKPEAIPLARLNELQDARVVIQSDEVADRVRGGQAASKLSVVLKTTARATDQSLFTYSAPTFRRNMVDTWVLDLKKFADQLKSLHAVDAAEVTVRDGQHRELTLFTIQKQVTFTDLKVRPDAKDDGSENLHISWRPQPNDPRTGRVLRIWPAENPAAAKVVSISDGAISSVMVPLQAPLQAGAWCLNLEVRLSRFGATGMASEAPPAFRWFRAPQNWADWLVWSEYTAAEARQASEDAQIACQSTRSRFLPWTEFLLHFHYNKGPDACQFMRNLLGGDTLLERLLPYSRNQIWDVKGASEKRVSVKVIASSAQAGRLNRLLVKQAPCLWYKLPDDIELELLLLTANDNLGKVHAVWKCTKTAAEPHACLYSEEEGHLDLPIWLEDALAPTTTGALMARCMLSEFWDHPPHLPGLQNIRHEDGVFAAPPEPQTPPSSPQKEWYASGKGFHSLGNLLGTEKLKKLAGFFKPVEPADQVDAERCVDGWNNWLNQHCRNSFLRRILSGRLQAGPSGLSGAVALVARLRSRQQWSERLHHGDLAAWSDINSLYDKTATLVCRATPRAFFRDLILSEIIVAWYWNQALAEI